MNEPFTSRLDVGQPDEAGGGHAKPLRQGAQAVQTRLDVAVLVAGDSRLHLRDPAYLQALRDSKRLSRREGILAVMNEHNLDAIFAPTGQPSWTTDLVNGDHFLNSDSSPAAVAGFPQHHGSGRVHGGAADPGVLHGTGLERTQAHRVRVRVRAGGAGAACAEVPAVVRRSGLHPANPVRAVQVIESSQPRRLGIGG